MQRALLGGSRAAARHAAVRRPRLPQPSCLLAFMTHNDCFYNSSDDDMLELLRALDYHTANESDVDD
jgi:hypothetical protein